MRVWVAVVTLAAVTAFSGCLNPQNSSRQPSPTGATAVVSTSSASGMLAIPSLIVTFDGEYLIVDYTLAETSGQSSVVLESMTFESGGRSNFIDAWCWGDAPIRIAPLGAVDRKSPLLGDYCQPGLSTKTPGDSASLTVVYRQNDGTRETVRATVPIRGFRGNPLVQRMASPRGNVETYFELPISGDTRRAA